MPRSLVLGNGSFLATFDEHLRMRDCYFPYVGMEDHTTYGHMHRLGFFVEGRGFAWSDDEGWTKHTAYLLETLIGHTHMEHAGLGLAIDLEDGIHPVHNILIRRFRIRSMDGEAKRVRLFFHHDFYIYGDKQKDTAFFEPYTDSVIHYREKRYFLIGGQTDRPLECRREKASGTYDSVLHSRKKTDGCALSAFTVGKADYRGLEGTWRDAEDGELSMNPIEQGSVDSTVAIHCAVEPGEATETSLWLCLGTTLDEVVNMQQIVMEETPERLLRNCHNYWKSWCNKLPDAFGSLSPDIGTLYKRSLMMVRLHADANGGIVAAADSDIQAFNRDTYTYVWPRDGAFICLALDSAGYGEISRRFFEFCASVQSPDGYLLHKYNPDGSAGSSWHPWYRDGEAQLPIQEDETALVLVAMARHIEQSQDYEFLQRIFERFVKKAAQFLCDFREKDTGLPLPSYDPWEEHRGIFSYTVATVIAGLEAAARMAQMLGHHLHSQRYHTAADDMKQAMLFHLYDEETGRFAKKIKREHGVTVEQDLTPDASLSHIWKLGILSADDPRIVSTMRQLKEHLWVRTAAGGMARYTNDYYQSCVPPTKDIPGNPWIITTLWYADWLIATATTREDLQEAADILQWTADLASPTGILPEQIHPLTRAPVSVAPLTWSHATFIDTVRSFVRKERALSQR